MHLLEKLANDTNAMYQVFPIDMHVSDTKKHRSKATQGRLVRKGGCTIDASFIASGPLHMHVEMFRLDGEVWRHSFVDLTVLSQDGLVQARHCSLLGS